jgi:predicted ATP-dependent Lon-type protease
MSSDLDQKSTTVFAGKVVRKDLVRKVKVGANVPVFVLEYLLGNNFTEIIDRQFSLGLHLNARDVKAVRKTVSGLIKLLHPHGEVTKDELAVTQIR